jgi:predicted N-acetyltransferase YhbS
MNKNFIVNSDGPHEFVQRIPELAVDKALDLELCQLLQICFPDENKFKQHRYYNEVPEMRWIIRVDGQLVAHIAAHSKEVHSDRRTFQFCGLSEVCVAPSYRGQGLLKPMLDAMEDYYAKLSYDFSILLGPAKVYTTYAYCSATNLHFPEESNLVAKFAMYKTLGKVEWPQQPATIQGPYF